MLLEIKNTCRCNYETYSVRYPSWNMLLSDITHQPYLVDFAIVFIMNVYKDLN